MAIVLPTQRHIHFLLYCVQVRTVLSCHCRPGSIMKERHIHVQVLVVQWLHDSVLHVVSNGESAAEKHLYVLLQVRDVHDHARVTIHLHDVSQVNGRIGQQCKASYYLSSDCDFD